MIENILLISQGPNDRGFVEGLKHRLGCEAALRDYAQDPNLRIRGQSMRRGEWRILQDSLRSVHVDLIVRLTDADEGRPQTVENEERSRCPDALRGILVIGVCDRCVESWMTLDMNYASNALGLPVDGFPNDPISRAQFVKGHIRRSAADEDYHAFVSGFVRDAPPDAFTSWLRDRSFQRFYDACRAAAARADCPIRDERDE